MARKISKSRRQRIIEDIDLELGMIGFFLLFLILFLFLEKDMILLIGVLIFTFFVLLILKLLLKKNLSDKFIPNFLK
jgi:hypothetical protein